MLSLSHPARVERTRSRTRSRLEANAGHDEGPLHSALVHASWQTRTNDVIEIRDPSKFHSARPGRVGDSHWMAVRPVVLHWPHQREGRRATFRTKMCLATRCFFDRLHTCSYFYPRTSIAHSTSPLKYGSNGVTHPSQLFRGAIAIQTIATMVPSCR